ncbi:MAG: hypothetical protein CTY30_00870 [Methylocystis sp.]|nr:MAG: hypothetical protein CTY30_00870 [Methylocystis sp.]
MTRRLQRLAALEFRAEARAKSVAALAAERVRSLTDDELSALVAFAAARPDLEFFTPEDFCAAAQWSREQLNAFLFGNGEIQ